MIRKRSKGILAIALVLVLAVSLVGCGTTTPAPTTPAAPTVKSGVTINVWSHFTPTEVAALKPIAEEWAKKTNNTVNFVADNSDFQAFATAAQNGKGPDIMFGLPHDNLGTFQKAGLLVPVPGSVMKDSDYVPLAIQAVSYDGKKYAVPLSMETYALFYNTQKVPTPPTTWDDFIAQAQKVGFQYDINNFYFTNAFLTGEGGYVFKAANGALDPNDIGMNNEGAVKGAQLVQDFVTKYHFMPADISGNNALAAFQNGKTGFYISGPWDVAGLKKANTPFAITNLPALPDGKASVPFVGVYTAFVSAKSANVDTAWDLVKYMLQKSPETLFKVGNRIPVVKSYQNDPAVQNDPVIKAFMTQANQGVPMPNITAMAAVWGPAGDNLKLLTQGKDVKTVLDAMVAKIKSGIALQQ